MNSLVRVATALAQVGDDRRQAREELPPRPVEHGNGIEGLKASIGDLYDFVSQYVDLDERGRGSCPFHPPDRHPSFAVNREEGYWVCFHEVNPETGRYLGGDAIEFYRRLRGLDFGETVTVLAQQYGMQDPTVR